MTATSDDASTWRGLYVRARDKVVPAPEDDVRVARGYPGWADKGTVVDGMRLTILTKDAKCAVGAEIRVIHVLEVVEPGRKVYIMGPKPVFGEYVDQAPATPPPPEGEDPFVPSTYNGMTVPSPAVDYGYEITQYRFERPGVHEIWWRLPPLESNVLRLEVLAV